jgi:hypothetical protein
MSRRKRDGAPPTSRETLTRAPLLIREVPGDTPRERLAWLLDFAYLDLGNADEATHSKLWSLLTGLVRDVTKGRWRVPFSEKPEREAFRLLKSGILREAVKQQDHDLWYPGRLDWVQERVRQTISTLGNIARLRDIEVVYRDNRDVYSTPDFYFQVRLPDGIMVALATLRSEVPASLVRQCLWESERCLRFFVATKRQKWCGIHQDAARRERDRRAQERFRERQKSRDRAGSRSPRRRSQETPFDGEAEEDEDRPEPE